MKGKLLLSILLISAVIGCDEKDISDLQADKFVKFYKNYPEFTAADVARSGSGYVILGTVKTKNETTQICLIRTDEFGNSIDSARYYGRTLNEKAHALKVLSDGGFAILAASQNPSSEKLEVYFIRTDRNGDIMWSRAIGETGNVEANNFDMDDQGYFYMTGYTEPNPTLLDRKIWWFALKDDGSNLWGSPKTYPGTNDNEGMHLQVMDDGCLVITGHASRTASGSTYSQVFALKTDEYGGVNYYFRLDKASNEEGNCIRILDEDNVLVLCTTKSLSGSAITLKQIQFSTLELNWEKNYGNTGKDVAKSMLTGNNTIHMLGTTGSAGDNNTAISLIAADALGNQTARSDFGGGSELSAEAFEQTDDGGFIIVGTNNHSLNNISVALIKVDADLSF